MKKEQRKSRITGLMALIVFALFAVCILGVLLTGADVYRKLVAKDRQAYDRRTAAQYVTTRVRQADTAESVSVEDFSGCSAITFREEIEGKTYLTRVYCYDGYIRELFASEGGEFSPEDGEKIIEAAQLSFDWNAPVLSAQIELTDGTQQTLTLTIRSAQEEVP